MNASRLLPFLLLLALPMRPTCAGASAAVHTSMDRTMLAPVAGLPASLFGVAGVTRALSASERLLARSPRAHLVRRRYGPTEVAQVTSSGIKEHHPPAVCLKASGLEVSQRTVEPGVEGCLVHLLVRSDNDEAPAHFFYAYVHRGRISCSYGDRVIRALAERLLPWRTGGDPRWTTIQVLDRDPQRARRAATNLLNAIQHIENKELFNGERP